MVTWKLLTDEEALQSWDRTLLTFDDCSPYQSYSWGEYRKGLGWMPCRWTAIDEREKLVALMHGALRRYPFGVGLVWCEGGPIGDLSVCDQSLLAAIKATTGLKHVYCRFRCDRARNIEDSLRLVAQGWSLSWSPLTTCYSMALDLKQDEDRLLAACDRNFRRNLRRAGESNCKVEQWFNPDVRDVVSVYESMQDLKGIDEQLSGDEIRQMIERLGRELVLYRCVNEAGKVVSLQGVLVVGGRAVSLLWATNEEGRRLLASYAILWALVQHCQKIGVRIYDLAGVDPIRNHGVYRFKRSSGASPIEYLGEWDCATSAAMQWFGNWSIANRDKLKQVESLLKMTRVRRSWQKAGVFRRVQKSKTAGFTSAKPVTLKG
jgi:FemAB family